MDVRQHWGKWWVLHFACAQAKFQTHNPYPLHQYYLVHYNNFWKSVPVISRHFLGELCKRKCTFSITIWLYISSFLSRNKKDLVKSNYGFWALQHVVPKSFGIVSREVPEKELHKVALISCPLPLIEFWWGS